LRRKAGLDLAYYAVALVSEKVG
jgi:hypothetical protein